LGMFVGAFGCGGVVGAGVGVGFGVGVGNSCLCTMSWIGVGVGVAFMGSELLNNGCEGTSCFAACCPHALNRIVIPSSTTRSREFLNAKIKLLLIE